MQAVWGCAFTGAGAFIITAALRGDPALNMGGSVPLGIFAGLLFLVPGLWALQAHRLLTHFIGEHYRGDWNTIWGGVIACLIGTFIMVMSVADPDDSNFNAPRWVAGAGGGVFVLAGILILKTELIDKGNKHVQSIFNGLVVTLLITVFGAIMTWTSLGPGEREFSSSVGLPFIRISGEGNEMLGRLCFLPWALLLDALAAVLWLRVAALVRQRGEREDGL